MATSKTEICNLAISWVGGIRITSLDDDDSKEANVCRAHYESSRKSVLEEREWTFSVKRAILNPLSSAPAWGFSHQFQLPSDCLRTLDVFDVNECDITYTREDRLILADVESIKLRYQIDLTNTNKFSGLFIEALSMLLASKIAIPLTKNRQLMTDMVAMYEGFLQKAISTDSLQGSRERLKRSRLEMSRRHFTPFD